MNDQPPDDLALTGAQQIEFATLLLDAFRTADDLERLVRFSFGQDVDATLNQTSRAAYVDGLIAWADARDQLRPLLESAMAQNPANRRLRAFAAAQGLSLPPMPAPLIMPITGGTSSTGDGGMGTPAGPVKGTQARGRASNTMPLLFAGGVILLLLVLLPTIILPALTGKTATPTVPSSPTPPGTTSPPTPTVPIANIIVPTNAPAAATPTGEAEATVPSTPAPTLTAPTETLPPAIVSPSGERIAFTSNRKGGRDHIWVMNAADGTSPQQITDGLSSDYNPVWLPDGRRIAFASFRGGTHGLYIVDAVGGTPTPVMTFASTDRVSFAWSPHGDRIAVAEKTGGRYMIAVMQADGSQRKIVTDIELFLRDPNDNVQYPSWNPKDDNQIVCTADRTLTGVFEGMRQIYVLNVGEKSARLIPTNNLYYGGNNTHPVWSPKGTFIAFAEDTDEKGAYATNVVGGDAFRVTTLFHATEPTWSPDEMQLALAASVDYNQNQEIYVVNADGSGKPLNLTNDPAKDYQPAWGPATP